MKRNFPKGLQPWHDARNRPDKRRPENKMGPRVMQWVSMGAIAVAFACAQEPQNATRSTAIEQEDCTLTQGFWKNHAEDWPVASLMLGANTYTSVELMAILDEPVAGNGLIALAHQLIAA